MKLDKNLLNKVIYVAAGLAIAALVVMNVYSIGRNKGRDETVQMISSLAEKYEFYIKDEDGWQIAQAKGGLPYEDFKSTVMYNYDADDKKINLSYNK